MSLGNIYFILVRPQMGENIGSVARAIKNFNIKYLRIVNPRCHWPNQKALATSVGAKDIIRKSKVHKNLEQALGNIDILIATATSCGAILVNSMSMVAYVWLPSSSVPTAVNVCRPSSHAVVVQTRV